MQMLTQWMLMLLGFVGLYHSTQAQQASVSKDHRLADVGHGSVNIDGDEVGGDGTTEP